MAETCVNDNSVDYKNQLKGSIDSFYVGDISGTPKILIFGNSITKHSPKPEIGWENDWGMAASEKSKDYLHVLYSMLKDSGLNPLIKVKQIAKWEREFDIVDLEKSFFEEKDFSADIVIFRIGENSSNITNDNKDIFKNCFENFVRFLKKENTQFIFNTCFWKNPLVDEVATYLAQKYGKLVYLDDLGSDENMKAIGKFWHYGVSIHPSDLGMSAIAKRLFSAIVNK